MTSQSSRYTGNIAWKAQSEDSNEKQDGTRADFLLQHTRYWMNEWCIYIALYCIAILYAYILVCLAVKGGLFPSLEPVCLVLVQDSGYTWLGNHNSFRNPWILLVVKCLETEYKKVYKISHSRLNLFWNFCLFYSSIESNTVCFFKCTCFSNTVSCQMSAWDVLQVALAQWLVKLGPNLACMGGISYPD